ncbi:GNAT family N-acetyltransferase [bacterium]|nr:GNAT family N-acetyltransferase [bacterium]
MNIRTATAKDVQRIWEIRTRAILESCLSHYPKAIVTAWAHSPMPDNFDKILIDLNAIIAESIDVHKKTTILGFGFIDIEQSRFESLFVDPYATGKGIGKMVAETLISSAQKADLTELHLSSSLNAVDFYQKMGFTALEETRWQHPAGFTLASVSMSTQLTSAS